MDGRVYLPSHADLLPIQVKHKLDEKEKNETLVIVRDEKNILECEYVPSLHFKEMVKDEIIADITVVTESKLTGWTHEGQKLYLDKALAEVKLEDEILIKSFANPAIRSTLLDLMLYGKYILQYRKRGSDHDKELYFINLFKEQLLQLIEKYPEVKQLIHALSEAKGFLRILPLAYHEIIKNDDLILDFRASELVGHNVAYQVGRNEDKYKKLVVISKQGNILETYSLKEIKVIKNKQRDMALKGVIVIPMEDKQQSVTTVYVSWAGTHNSATQNADFERTPGEESYRCGEDQILRQIISAIIMLGKPVRLVICGHSLGGALAQLSFHSMQRVIAASLQEKLIHEKVIFLEEEFHKELYTLSPHQRDLGDIKIDPKIIRDMSVDVWNSAGVLQPVVNQTNQLCPILVNAGIPQLANFGLVSDDMLQAVGQGYILSNVFENGAKIKILKIQSKVIDAIMATVGLPAAATVALISTNAAGWLVSLCCLVAVFAKMISLKSVAHRKHHFINGSRPEDAYVVYNSHYPDGSINAEVCKIIQNELTAKSTTIIDRGLHYISDAIMQSERFKSEFIKVRESCKRKSIDEQKDLYFELHTFLIKRMQTDEACIIKLITEGEIEDLINMTDSSGKTLLHYALFNGQFDLAQTLLTKENIDVNTIDQDKNFPLLIYMEQINNSYLPISQEASRLGLKLLEKTTLNLTIKNIKQQSVEQFYKKWYWSGTNAKRLMMELAKRLAPPLEKKPEPESKPIASIV